METIHSGAERLERGRRWSLPPAEISRTEQISCVLLESLCVACNASPLILIITCRKCLKTGVCFVSEADGSVCPLLCTEVEESLVISLY